MPAFEIIQEQHSSIKSESHSETLKSSFVGL
jgi:hypothetical protein